jgi:hypothetical protein
MPASGRASLDTSGAEFSKMLLVRTPEESIMPHARRIAICLLFCSFAAPAKADPPHVSYIFPAGGQRGTMVGFRVGGHNLYEGAPFRMFGEGVSASEQVELTQTTWFEGPVIEQPASQRKEDYPKDYSGSVEIAADAPLGLRHWRVSTSQGVTPRMKFVVGTLPEIIEEEVDGDPIPTRVNLPVTINGRVFPREDIDIWTFEAKAGETISCEAMSARLGSPLDSRLEIRSPGGRVLTQNVDSFGADSFVRFAAPSDGVYECRIHDINFSGLQNFVYRLSIRKGASLDSVFPLGGQRGTTIAARLVGMQLPKEPVGIALPGSKDNFVYWNWTSPDGTTTRPVQLALSDLPEAVEVEPNDAFDADTQILAAKLPSVLNGRIGKPGDIDLWKIEAEPESTVRFEVFASRLGTDLDSILRIVDETGKQIVMNDDLKGGVVDSRLNWKVPKGGPWFLEVKDQLPSRGGDRFAYRVEVTEAPASDFALVLSQDSLSVDRGGEVKLKLNIERAGFAGEIELAVDGLPKGVTVEGTKVGKNKPNTQLTFKATDATKIQLSELTISGKSVGEETEITRTAKTEAPFGEPVVDRLSLAVTNPTPFKFRSPFETKYASRGTTYSRHFFLDRNGFEGPIEIEMADRQVRHLQGVTGEKVIVPPGESEFDYTVTLPSWMKIGRTSRTTLIASGLVEDPDGSRHRVSYSSQAQDDQVIVLVDPVRLSLDAARKSLGIRPGTTVSLPIEVKRGPGLTGAAVVRVRSAKHIRGWKAEPVRVESDSGRAELRIEFDANPGPFNMPLIVEGRMMDERGQPVTFEMPLKVRILK